MTKKNDIIIKILKKLKIDYSLSSDSLEARAICPLPDHEDSTPSFSINIKTGKWICFGCGQQGDIKRLCELTGISLPDFDDYDLQIEEVLLIMEDNKNDDGIIKKTSIKFDSMELPVFKHYLIKEHKIWLNKKCRGKINWDKFDVYTYNRKYIIFPIYYENKSIGYSMRCAKGIGRKYINSRNEIFRQFVYMGNDIDPTKEVYIVEGFIDAIFLRGKGLQAVATFGARFGDGQIEFLRYKGVKDLVLFFDYDKAGISAFFKYNKKLSKYFNLFYVFNPLFCDPKKSNLKKLIITDFEGWKNLYEIHRML